MDDVTESIILDVVETLVALVAAVDILLVVCTTLVTLDVMEILSVAVTLAVVDVGGVVSADEQSLADSAIYTKHNIILYTKLYI